MQPGRSVVSKFSAILMTFRSGGSHSLSEIAALSELPISTAHRIVSDLTDWLVLERDLDGRTYRPGAALKSIVATQCCANRNLRDRAAPWLDDLHRAINAEIRLGVLDLGRVRYIQKARHGPVTRFSAAATLPVHATGLGKVLLAFAPDREVEQVLSRPLRSYTSRTITDRDQLRWILKRARLNGFAIADRELRIDLKTIAAPVFGSGGAISAAIEVEVRDLVTGIDSSWPALAVAAAGLSRELDRPCAHCADRESDADPGAPFLARSAQDGGGESQRVRLRAT